MPIPPEWLAESESERRVRPDSVVAAAVILYLYAGLSTLACLGFNADLAYRGSGVLVVRAVLGTLALGYLLLGLGIQAGREWARICAVGLGGLGLALRGVSLFTVGGGLVEAAGIIIDIVIITLPMSNSAHEYFRHR